MAETPIVHFIGGVEFGKHWSGMCTAKDGLGTDVPHEVTCEECRKVMKADPRRRALHVLSPYTDGAIVSDGYKVVMADCGHQVVASTITVELLANNMIDHTTTCADCLIETLGP